MYSHSRLSSFEQCRQKYKFRYIDKIKPDIEKSIEAHLGICIHDSLEWLYKEVLNGKLPELDDLIKKYTKRWQEDFKENFLIVKKQFKAEDYLNDGVKFLIDYYVKHKPFKDGTLELEKRIFVTLEKDSPHKIIGFIDRLTFNKEKNQYEVHDYKTANSLPPRHKFDEDRQLALYALAIKQLNGHDKTVVLTWHYLRHNIQIFSNRTNEQLEKLKQDTLKLIHKIEITKDFPPKKSILCDWCEYKSICPAWNKEIKQESQERLFPTASKYIKD